MRPTIPTSRASSSADDALAHDVSPAPTRDDDKRGRVRPSQRDVVIASLLRRPDPSGRSVATRAA